jgi:hypothetical protein
MFGLFYGISGQAKAAIIAILASMPAVYFIPEPPEAEAGDINPAEAGIKALDTEKYALNGNEVVTDEEVNDIVLPNADATVIIDDWPSVDATFVEIPETDRENLKIIEETKEEIKKGYDQNDEQYRKQLEEFKKEKGIDQDEKVPEVQ